MKKNIFFTGCFFLCFLTGVCAITENILVCTQFSDILKHQGKDVLVLGRYEVDLVEGGKRLQAVHIVLADQTRLIRAYRPIKNEYQFIGKRVQVFGKAYKNAGLSPDIQQVLAPHIYPTSIQLQKNEIPYAQIPIQIPEGPWILTAQDITPWDNHWVHLYGKLLSVSLQKNQAFWSDAVLELPDKTQIAIFEISTAKWKKLEGSMITVTGIIRVKAQDKESSYYVNSLTAVCPGKIERCGIHDPK